MNKIKNNPFLLVSSVVSLVLGLWLLFTEPTRIINLIYFIVGGGLIVTGISKLLLESRFSDKSYTYDGVVNIAIGILIMFVHDTLITIILGLAFVVFPIIRIVKSVDKNYAFKQELPLLIIGLIIALSGDLIAQIFIKILGVLFILFAIYLFVCIFIEKIRFIKVVNYTQYHTNINRDVIDVDYEEGEDNE